jgi:type IV fimbrial biogenesis protein FimT
MRQQRGVTILELLIVITLLSVILAIAVPGYRQLVLNNRQATAVNELVTALQLARSEAITRNVAAPAVVSVCASSNGTGCSGTWSDGWIVFIDSDGPAAINVDEVLRAADAPPGLEIGAPGAATAISYRRDGRTLAAADFVFCDSRGASKARVIQLGLSGRPSVSKYRSDGSAPTCS